MFALPYIAAILALGVAPLWAGDTIFVDCNAHGGKKNGRSWFDAFTRLEVALKKAPPGAEIWIADGEYRSAAREGDAAFVALSRLQIYGGFRGANGPIAGETRREQRAPDRFATILHGAGLNGGARQTLRAGDRTLIDGIHITGGRALNGAGLFIESDAAVTVRSCVFRDNHAQSAGGALFSAPRSRPIIERCEFLDNSAGSIGGGCALYSGVDPAVRACEFSRNRAAAGAAAAAVSCAVRFVNSVFYANVAESKGGALYIRGSDGDGTRIVNTTITCNVALRGGGVYADSSHAAHVIRIVNSIVWSNRAQEHGNELFIGGSTVSIAYTTLGGGLSGIVAMRDTSGKRSASAVFTGGAVDDADPLFMNAPVFCDRARADSSAGAVSAIAVRDPDRYRPGDILEFDNDGVARAITSIAGERIAFAPAVAAAGAGSLFVENWGRAQSRAGSDRHTVWDTVVTALATDRCVVSEPSRFIPGMLVVIDGVSRRISAMHADTIVIEPPLMHAIEAGTAIKIMPYDEMTARPGSAAHIPAPALSRLQPGSYVHINGDNTPRLITALDFDSNTVSFFPPLSVNAAAGTRIQLWPWRRAVRDGARDTIHVAAPMQFAPGDRIEIDNDGVCRTIAAISGSSIAFAPPAPAPVSAGHRIDPWRPSLRADLHLRKNSPCIDAGIFTLANSRDTVCEDFHGMPRLKSWSEDAAVRQIVDRGAYEAIYGISVKAHHARQAPVTSMLAGVSADSAAAPRAETAREARLRLDLGGTEADARGRFSLPALVDSLRGLARSCSRVAIDFRLPAPDSDTRRADAALPLDSASRRAFHAGMRAFFDRLRKDGLTQAMMFQITADEAFFAYESSMRAYALMYDAVLSAMRNAGIERNLNPFIECDPHDRALTRSIFRGLGALLASDTLHRGGNGSIDESAIWSKTRCRLMHDQPIVIGFSGNFLAPMHEPGLMGELVHIARCTAESSIRRNTRLSGVPVLVYAEQSTPASGAEASATKHAPRIAAVYTQMREREINRCLLWSSPAADSGEDSSLQIAYAEPVFSALSAKQLAATRSAGTRNSLATRIDACGTFDPVENEIAAFVCHSAHAAESSDTQHVAVVFSGLGPRQAYRIEGRRVADAFFGVKKTALAAGAAAPPVSDSAAHTDSVASPRRASRVHKPACIMNADAGGSLRVQTWLAPDSFSALYVQPAAKARDSEVAHQNRPDQ
jgi:hypothetical protein